MSEPTAQDIAANVRAVLARVEAAAKRARRNPALVRVVAVSKTKPTWMIDAARGAGATCFGENYVQEALAKQLELKTPPGTRKPEWHLVGKLQSNKAKQVVGRFSLLHAVDSAKLALELDKRAAEAGVGVDVLIEVNLASESSKAGVSVEAIETLLQSLVSVKRLRIRGLMAMPPPQDGDANRPYFKQLAQLGAALRGKALLPGDATELSMGTTADFEAAIEEGATLVRIGTAIFGPREPKVPVETKAAPAPKSKKAVREEAPVEAAPDDAEEVAEEAAPEEKAAPENE